MAGYIHTVRRRRQTGFFFRARLRITTKPRGDLKIEILAFYKLHLNIANTRRDCGCFQQVFKVMSSERVWLSPMFIAASFTRFLKHSAFKYSRLVRSLACAYFISQP